MKACCRFLCFLLRPSASRLQSYLLLPPSENIFQPADIPLCQGVQHTPLLPRLCYGTYYNCIFCGCQAGTQKFYRYFSNCIAVCSIRRNLVKIHIQASLVMTFCAVYRRTAFYSTDFKDSTILIFVSFLCINQFTTTEKIQVITAQYKKLTGRMSRPNITASTSTVRIIYQ